MDSIYLQGSETVHQASRNMQAAADQMQQTVVYLDEVLTRFSHNMEGWLERLEALKDPKTA